MNSDLKPLNLALVHRDSPRMIDRMHGWFSYEVPEFAWTHYPVGKHFELSRDDLARKHDVIIYEDAKIRGDFTGRADIPICYVVSDSTLSPNHYQHRFREACKADLILVDWDHLYRFYDTGKPVVRFSYCVNDRVFYPGEPGASRPIDVAMHHHRTPERGTLERWGEMFCKGHGLKFSVGVKAGADYAQAFRQAKIVINLHRNETTRSHRMFDVMASGACLVTSKTPYVSCEERTNNVDYRTYNDLDHLSTVVRGLLEGETWREYAIRGYNLVMEHHTWRVRAKYLRAVIREKLGI